MVPPELRDVALCAGLSGDHDDDSAADGRPDDAISSVPSTPEGGLPASLCDGHRGSVIDMEADVASHVGVAPTDIATEEEEEEASTRTSGDPLLKPSDMPGCPSLCAGAVLS